MDNEKLMQRVQDLEKEVKSINEKLDLFAKYPGLYVNVEPLKAKTPEKREQLAKKYKRIDRIFLTIGIIIAAIIVALIIRLII